MDQPVNTQTCEEDVDCDGDIFTMFTHENLGEHLK
jgi:hypothetical protein